MIKTKNNTIKQTRYQSVTIPIFDRTIHNKNNIKRKKANNPIERIKCKKWRKLNKNGKKQIILKTRCHLY